jgi:CzcA family heavy metal efflux pump
MMRWIVGTSLRARYLVVALAIAMMIFGFTEINKMPVDVFPEFAPPYVTVQTEAQGLSAVEVEELLTLNMEEALTGTAEMQTIRSESVPGLSWIQLTFLPGTDVIRARQFVQERLITQTGLPKVSRPPEILQPLSATNRVMMIGLSTDEMNLTELSTIAFWKISLRLMAVPGVANVAIWGHRMQDLQIQVDPERLLAYGLTLEQIIETTGNALPVSALGYLDGSTAGTGGWIDTPQQRIGVEHVSPIVTTEELAQVVIERGDGSPVQMSDLGLVVEDHPPLIGDAVLKNGAGLLLVVQKLPGSNTLEVTQGLEEVLNALQFGLPGIEIDTQVFQAADFIEMALGNLTRTLIIGAILVVLILIAFLFEWRAALISVVAIPLSLMAALLVLYLNEATINTMILAGLVIALGAVVDDAIIDVENIIRRLRQNHKDGTDRSIPTIIIEASLEMRGAIVFATFIMVLAVLPVFFLEGLSGAFFQPLVLAYALALLASMLVALTVTPALSMILLPRAPLEHRVSPLIRWLQRRYGKILARIIHGPRFAYITVLVFTLAGLVISPFLGQDLLPAFKERDLVIRWESPPGTSHPEMMRITTEVIHELQSVPGVRNANAHIGRAILGDEIVDVNSAKIWVSLDPGADYDATLAAIQVTVDSYPGMVGEVKTYLQEIIRQVLAGSDKAIVVRTYGPDFLVVGELAEQIGSVISQIDGVVDMHVESQVEEPHVEIKVDLDRVDQYGLIPGDVRRTAAAFIGGLEVGDIFKDKKVFEILVWTRPETRHSLTTISELPIDTPDGGQVRLGDVAEVRIASSPTVIKHEANLPRYDVGFNVLGRDLGSVKDDVERALQEIEFPLEYHPEIIGESAEREAVQVRIAGITVATAIGIFLLLQATFDSWRLASLSFLTLPSALVGGVLATVLTGGSVSVGSLVGFLTVLGIAARNGIMLIDHYRHLELHEGETFGPGLILRGARERLTPILMTALTTALALVPLVIAGNIPGHEIEHPMAIVVMGGLITATILNLFVMPALYLRFGRPSLEPVTSS